MLGESANNNIDLSQPYDEQIHRGLLWHGHPSQLDCLACYCYIVSMLSNIWNLIEFRPFSFMGISQSLPSTAYIKMIDIWMIFTMMYPFAEIVLVCAKEFFKKRAVAKQGWCVYPLQMFPQKSFLFCSILCVTYPTNHFSWPRDQSETGLYLTA